MYVLPLLELDVPTVASRADGRAFSVRVPTTRRVEFVVPLPTAGLRDVVPVTEDDTGRRLPVPDDIEEAGRRPLSIPDMAGRREVLGRR